jgi:two-component system chemotaxis sensor kinase CheA
MNLKKQIRLEISGEDLRVDHTIVEALNKCLIHIIRNSADHGIESASERTKVGKNTNGAITITAQEVKEEVIIRIQDDGRGIDPLRIKSKAIEKQIVSAQEADQMSDSQLRMLIFEPGFSTAEQVTDVSGRGVGTDMVKSTIVSMGGHIELNSEVGKGTEFIFRLPIPKSVLIISSLLVKDKDRTVAIPQDCVTRIISLSDDTKMNQIRSLGTTLVFQDQDRLIPVLSLSKILNSQFSAGQNSDLNETSFSKLVCVRSKNGPYCIQVDEVLNIEDTVVKQVGKWLRSVSTYLGVTFLADGRIGPILDIDGIAQKMCFEPLAANKIETSNPGSSQTSSADSKFVLLFDLGTDCTYGAMQTEIFRLEVIDTSEIQHSGNQSVVIYRGQTMPLISLSGALNIGNDCPNNSHSADQNKLQILVVQISGKFHGFIVRSIGDFVEVQSNDNTLELESLNQKIYIINSKTVTLLSLHHYISD